jgi:hypothetical protein
MVHEAVHQARFGRAALGRQGRGGVNDRDIYAGNLKLTTDEGDHRFAGELRPGAVVIYTGKALRAMGLRTGDAGQARFVISACSCELCQLGRHVCVERPNGRHVARAAVRVLAAGEHYLDEGAPDQTSKDMGDIGKGLRRAIKRNTKISVAKPSHVAKNWRDCRAFVRALRAREYLVDDRPVMSEGIYWYLYELWQDGTRAGALAYKNHVAQHGQAKGTSSHRKGRRRHDAA